MCDAWAEKDSRIRVIHKENGGVASARNVGLDNAVGQYISFVDSDDWIDSTMIAELVSCLCRVSYRCNRNALSHCLFKWLEDGYAYCG